MTVYESAHLAEHSVISVIPSICITDNVGTCVPADNFSEPEIINVSLWNWFASKNLQCHKGFVFLDSGIFF